VVAPAVGGCHPADSIGIGRCRRIQATSDNSIALVDRQGDSSPQRCINDTKIAAKRSGCLCFHISRDVSKDSLLVYSGILLNLAANANIA